MHSMLYFTAKDEEDAARIARELLDQRLIACANVFPVRSLYRWQGTVEEAHEAVAICKTRRDRVRQAIEVAKRIHTYEVPCLVSYTVGSALAAYAQWIDEETKVTERRRPRTRPRASGRR